MMREKQVNTPAAWITSGAMSFWFQTRHIGAGGSVGSQHRCLQQRKAQPQPAPRAVALLLPPPSPGKPQPPGLGEVLKT